MNCDLYNMRNYDVNVILSYIDLTYYTYNNQSIGIKMYDTFECKMKMFFFSLFSF